MDARKRFDEQMLARFCELFPPTRQGAGFFYRLVHGVMDRREALDQLIESHSSNWKLSRMAGVDRNLLRIAVFEMLDCADIPAKVSINEAIELAKKFGTEDSGAFINGILDSIRIALDENRLDPAAFAPGAEARPPAGALKGDEPT